MAEDTEKKIKIIVDSDDAKDNIKDVKNAVGDLKDNLSVTSIASKGLGGTIKSLGSSFMSLTKAAWSFVATPIGAIISAIVLAATALYSIFKDFQPVLDKVEQLFSALSAAGQVLKNTFIGLFTGTKSLKESFSNLGGSMKAAADEAIALTKAEQDLDDQLKINEIRNKEAEAQINKLLVQSKNRSLSEKERTALINEAMTLEQKAFELTKKNADEEYDIAMRRLINGKNLTKEQIADLKERGIAAAFDLQNIAKISDEEIDRLKNAYVAKIDIQNKSTQLVEKSQNRLDQLADKQKADDEKRRADSAAKKQKDIEDALKAAEDKNKKDLVLIKEQALAEGTSKEELDKLIEDKELEHITNMIALRKSLGQDTLDLENTIADKRIAINDRIAKEEAKIAEEKKKKEEEDAKKAEEEKRKKDEEDAAAKKSDMDNDKLSYENRIQAATEYYDALIAKAKEAGEATTDIEKEKNEKTKELEKSKNRDLKDLLLEGYENLKAIDEQYTQFKENLLSGQLKRGEISQKEYDKKLAEVEKKAAQRKKVFAIADTIINTATSIMSIWSSAMKIDPTGILATSLSVAAGILGAAQVATIASTPVDGGSTGSASSGSMPSASGTGGGTAPTTSFSFADAPKTIEQPVVKTYVVAKDVATQQQLDRQTINNGTI